MTTPRSPFNALPSLSGRWTAWAQPLWHKLSARERQAVWAAATVCAAALLWWGALAPALATLRQAPTRHAQLDAELSDMRRLSAVATRLQAQPARGRTERLAALEADTKRLLGDSASVRVSGDQATVSLRTTRPEALAQWLADVRANARLTPAEARLSRANPTNPNTPTSAASSANAAAKGLPASAASQTSATSALWQGELVFALGGADAR